MSTFIVGIISLCERDLVTTATNLRTLTCSSMFSCVVIILLGQDERTVFCFLCYANISIRLFRHVKYN